MANKRTRDDDLISQCGSFSGETFSSRRPRNSCTLRQHSVNNIAAQLRQLSFDQNAGQDYSNDPSRAGIGFKKRLNSIFHYYRFVVVMFGGLSVGLMMLLRYNITVAILNMVNQTALYIEEHPGKTMEDFLAEGYIPGGEFNWDNEIQHMIMSWYMVAYTLPQIFTTKLGSIIGARLFIPISLGTCAISSILLPIMAYWGWEYVIFLRLVNGIGASAVLPMLISLIEHWMPYDQISLGLTFAQLLQALCTAANPLVSGYLASIHWSWAFYGPGAFTILFCTLWLILVTDRPDDNWLISEHELGVICGCEDHANHFNKQVSEKTHKGEEMESDQRQTTQTVSWTRVLRVPSFYFFIVMWCFYCSAYSSFSFILPTYLRQFMKIPISKNGVYCFMIQTGGILSVLWPHMMLKLLRNQIGLSETASRRLSQALVCIMVASTWIYVGWFNSAQIVLLFLNRVFHGANDIIVTGTLMTNYSEAGLSSLVFSIVNTFGNLTIVFASTFIGWVLDHTGQSAESWAYIYTGLAVSQLVFMFIFSTTITAGPIDLEPKKNKSLDDVDNVKQIDLNVEQSIKREGSSLNNFEKLKGSTTAGKANQTNENKQADS